MIVIEDLIGELGSVCAGLPDRRSGSPRDGGYSMADIGLSGFSLFCMGSPSFLAHQRALARSRGRPNCQTMFGMSGDFARAAGLTCLGIGAFLVALKLDARGAVRLFPHGSGDPRTVHGAGYATLFLFYVASMGLTVYGPAVLQTLRGLSALAAGYVVSAEALFWTAASLPVAGLAGHWPNRLIRLGAVAIFAGLASCALVFDDSHLAWVVLAGGLVGVGFGLSYAFISQGILGAVTDEERALGGAGIAIVRLTGAAVGSALAAAVANLAGFADGFSVPAAREAGIWVFLAALPVAALACLSAWHVAAPRAVRAADPS